MIGRVYIKLGSAHSFLGEYEEAEANFNKALNMESVSTVFNQMEIEQIKDDIQLIQRRVLSMKEKAEGDERFLQMDLNGAKGFYKTSLHTDPNNIYSYSNLALIGIIYIYIYILP